MEEWREVKGYEGLYEVSNYGNVRRVGRTRLFTGGVNHRGYKHVVLTKSGVKSTKLLHRLVAEAFVENPRKCPEVNHRDENKLNNHADNLEWCTHLENSNYGTRGKRIGESNKKRWEKIKSHDFLF